MRSRIWWFAAQSKGVPGPTEPRQVPTLSEWMQLLLAGFILALGLASLRRRVR
jgi:hypothetical protein